MMMRKYARATEKTGEHHVAAGSVRGAGSHQVRRHNTEQRAQLENVPSLAPKYGNPGPIARKRITLPRNGLDQCRLAAAIRSQDAYVLAARNLQVNVVKRRAVTTHYGDVRKGEQRFRNSVHAELSGDNHPAITVGNDSVILTEQRRCARERGKRETEEAARSAVQKIKRR